MAAAATAAKKVTLTSSDGENFDVDEEVAMESQTIKHMIEDGCADTDIPLPNVTGKILAKVIEYCKKPFEVRKQADEKIKPCHADFLKHMIEDVRADTDIPLPTGKIWANAIDWRQKRVEVKKQADEEIQTWDADFVKVDQATLFDLIMAANYLNVKSLLDLTCQTVADMIKGKAPDEIRKTLGLKSDLTPDEEEKVRRENSWAFK